MKPLENDVKINEGTGLKALAWNKLLTELPVLLAQIKTETIHTNYKRNKANTISFASA